MRIKNIHLDKHHAAQGLCSRGNSKHALEHAHTYCERGEGHAHAPEAIESQGNEDKDREFCK